VIRQFVVDEWRFLEVSFRAHVAESSSGAVRSVQASDRSTEFPVGVGPDSALDALTMTAEGTGRIADVLIGGAMKAKKDVESEYSGMDRSAQPARLIACPSQMARELGMNPNSLGKLDNHAQEPWKMPLRQYIEYLYLRRFGKECPDVVISIEEKVLHDAAKKEQKRMAKLARRQTETAKRDESGAQSS
jgi:hypothetical protein